MQKMSIKAYAIKHKLSIFNVMKMLKSGKVKSEVSQENGREVTYILYDEEAEETDKEKLTLRENINIFQINTELNNLKEEVALLRQEFEALKKK